MNNPESDPLHDSIRAEMELKDTDELLAIWRKQDRGAWTDEALGVVRELLVARLGQIPAQAEEGGQPVGPVVHVAEAEGDDEEADTYHNPETAMRIAGGAKTLAWAILVLVVAFVLFYLVTYFAQGRPISAAELIPLALTLLLYLVIGGFIYFALQAIGEGLYLLMDIEANGREATRKGR